MGISATPQAKSQGVASPPPIVHQVVTLALLAHAFLAVAAALERRGQAVPVDGSSPGGSTPLTCNEIQRLFTGLIARPVRDTAHRLQ